MNTCYPLIWDKEWYYFTRVQLVYILCGWFCPSFPYIFCFPHKKKLDPKQQTFPPQKNASHPQPLQVTKSWKQGVDIGPRCCCVFLMICFWWILMVWPLIHHQQSIKIHQNRKFIFNPMVVSNHRKKAMGFCWWILLGDKISGDAWRFFD